MLSTELVGPYECHRSTVYRLTPSQYTGQTLYAGFTERFLICSIMCRGVSRRGRRPARSGSALSATMNRLWHSQKTTRARVKGTSSSTVVEQYRTGRQRSTDGAQGSGRPAPAGSRGVESPEHLLDLVGGDAHVVDVLAQLLRLGVGLGFRVSSP